MSRFAPPGPLGFGGAPLGNMFAAIDETTAQATMRAAWDSGIRYFDTAPHYGAGLSEHRFGTMLRQCPRDEFVLSTKVGRLLTPDPTVLTGPPPFDAGLPFRASYDYSADGAMRSIADSLQRMGLSRLDVVYIHDIAEDAHGPGWREPFAKAMKGAGQALIRLREQGVIRAWGLGVNRIEACEAALEQSDPDVFLLAGRYSLLDHSALHMLFPHCMARGVHIVVGGPFNSGLLAGGNHFDYVPAPAELLAKRARLQQVCDTHDVDIRAAALQFCAAHPTVCAVIPGAKSPDKVAQNAALMRRPIAPAFWQALKKAGMLPTDAPTPGEVSDPTVQASSFDRLG
jgi:D-threo-aldose 1-dehydrogenase